MTTGYSVQRTSILTKLQRAAIVLNLGLGLGYGVAYVGLWVIAGQDFFSRADFTGFYTGWAMVRDGLGGQLYDLTLQARYQQQLLGGRSFSEGMLPFAYPPHTAVVFAPLAWVPLSYAYWFWTLAQVLLLIWLFHIFFQLAGDWQSPEQRLLLTATVAFPPLFSNFLLGQFSLWLLVCVLQLYRALKNGREGLAGLWFVLGTFKPQTMFLVGISLLAARRWRALTSAALFGGCLIVLSSLVLGWESWVGFLRALRFSANCFGIHGIHPTAMYNFKGTLALFLGYGQGGLINWITGMGLIAATILTFGIWRGPWQPDVPSFELRIALTTLLGMFFSPHLTTEGLILIAPATLFYIYLRHRQLPSLTYVILALACPVIFLIGENTLGGKLGIRIPTLIFIILMIWVALALKNERRRAA